MNREIKFRGKSLESNEWVYGYYYNRDDCLKGKLRHVIVNVNNSKGVQTVHDPIDINTLGQYTGVGDHFHNKIFEGDIVHYENMLTTDEEPFEGTVIFDEGSWWVSNEEELKAVPLWGEANYLRIKGNIYDNPELLEVK